ncbi:uncharacterized protein DNG_08605 [Cephalotrichum gorgonifer]|uniref:Uncharacterized protein n=1 Tax=Cephalotrichum gorgonifer TaxID=2041049 RepID=A0AAE8N3V3_9PEZI|nr:uncharacterized protein DNG_08605 [Cephalotrichum gorgonifer]
MAPMVPMVPMAPPSQHRPPMSPAGLAPVTRRHTAEEGAYNMGGPPPMERGVPGWGPHEYAEETHHMRMPPGRRHSEEIFTASTMAGLTGMGRGMNRVPEWLHYVEPGSPDDEPPPTTHRRRLHF